MKSRDAHHEGFRTSLGHVLTHNQGVVTRFSYRLKTERTFASALTQAGPAECACVCMRERERDKKNRIFTEIRARSHYQRTIHDVCHVCHEKKRVARYKITDERVNQVNHASLTKSTCPLMKEDTKNVDLTMVPRYVRDWLFARVVFAWVGVSVSLSWSQNQGRTRVQASREAQQDTGRTRVTSDLALPRKG